VAATPAPCRPRANGIAVLFTAAALRPQARCSESIARPDRPTSSTGARSTFTPIAFMLPPVWEPSFEANAEPFVPATCAETRGLPGRRRTSPPSWSLITKSGASTAAGLGISCSWRVSAWTSAGPPTFSEKRTTPATSPAEIIWRSWSGTARPWKPVTMRSPASWRAESSAGGAAATAGTAAQQAAKETSAIARRFPGIRPE
jgi:hypothetical protein